MTIWNWNQLFLSLCARLHNVKSFVVHSIYQIQNIYGMCWPSIWCWFRNACFTIILNRSHYWRTGDSLFARTFRAFLNERVKVDETNEKNGQFLH